MSGFLDRDRPRPLPTLGVALRVAGWLDAGAFFAGACLLAAFFGAAFFAAEAFFPGATFRFGAASARFFAGDGPGDDTGVKDDAATADPVSDPD